jgi:hypothetical protein
MNKREYDATYTVRAMYQNNAITQSGDSNPVSVTGNKTTIDIIPENFDVTIDSSSRSAKVNTSLLNLTGGVKVKDADGNNITDDCEITASDCSPSDTCILNGGNDSAKFTKAGNYTINIVVTYKGTSLYSPTLNVTVTE